MTQKHTPGPWNLIWWGNEAYPFPMSILADNDGAWIARGGTVSSEANARIIAAAPDMLEALLEVVDTCRADCPAGLPALVLARAAIAKAQGQQ